MIRLVPELPEKQYEWRNMAEVYLTCRQNELIWPKEQERWLAGLDGDKSRRFFGIELSPDRKIPGFQRKPVLIGTAGLTSIDRDYGKAEYSLLIGPEFWGKRYGTQALLVLLRYGFENLRLHRIWGEVMSHNPAGCRLAQGAGFTEEGRAREAYFKCGTYVDGLLYGMIEREFFDKHGKTGT